MSRRHEIKFKSYDRLFPSQDTMPRGGLGNLIALPLQKEARKKKKGRKKIKYVIGQIGAGKDTSSCIIDIAVMQSLSRQGDVKECVKKYGLIIADECHHASALTYEQILSRKPSNV